MILDDSVKKKDKKEMKPRTEDETTPLQAVFKAPSGVVPSSEDGPNIDITVMPKKSPSKEDESSYRNLGEVQATSIRFKP